MLKISREKGPELSCRRSRYQNLNWIHLYPNYQRISLRLWKCHLLKIVRNLIWQCIKLQLLLLKPKRNIKEGHSLILLEWVHQGSNIGRSSRTKKWLWNKEFNIQVMIKPSKVFKKLLIKITNSKYMTLYLGINSFYRIEKTFVWR